MKKYLLLMALCGFFSFQAKAEGEVTDKITISELRTDDKGQYFEVSFTGSNIIYTAYQVTIEIPEGLEIVYDDKNNPNILLVTPSLYPATKTTINIPNFGDYTYDTFTHSITSSYNTNGDNKLKLLCKSDKNEEFTGVSGELFKVYVKPSAYMKPGVSYIKTSEVMFSTNAGIGYSLPSGSYPITIGNSREISLNISATHQYNTCVLPFDAELPEGVRAFEGNSISEDCLILSEASSIQAFTPYILYAENGYEGTLSGTVDAEKYVTAATGDYLNGAIMPQEISEGYVMQDKGQGLMFYNVNVKADEEPFTIPSGKCWVSAAAGDAKAIRIGFGDTGIDALPFAGSAEKDAVYTLDGKRVRNPQKGNIYIKDGKKVLYLK